MTDSTLFTGGRVFTGRRYCDALLVEGGDVVVAGSEAEARRAAPAGVDRRDLAGGLLLPGLIDAHFHVTEVTRVREGLDLAPVRSIEALTDRIREWGVEHSSGPIHGRGWNPERSRDRRWPTRHDLDRAVPERRVVVVHASGHAMIVNSAVLGAAGFDRSTPDPPGGRLGRDPDGSPDGRLYEAAIRLLERRLGPSESPPPAALRRTMQWAASFGLTTLGAMSAAPEEANALCALSVSGSLPGRVRVYLHGGRWEEYFGSSAQAEGDAGRFKVVGVKEYTDGAFGTRTAWLSEPYADAPGTSGMAVSSEAPLPELLEAISKRGLAPALHAIGDRAVGYALGLLETFPRSSAAPPRIEHAGLTPPSLFAPLARVRPALVVQPGFVWSDSWLGERLGPTRARWAYAFRSLKDQGHLLAGSSDAPYDPVDPWRGIRAAVQRSDPEGRSANATPGESLTPEESLRLYTANGGAVLGEPALGLLEPGSPADLLVMRVPSVEQAVQVGCESVWETWVGGVKLARVAPS
jgi:predicted amidohydrolase YtcJ